MIHHVTSKQLHELIPKQVKKSDDPFYAQKFYECLNDYGKVIYKSGLREFELYDARGNFITGIGMEIAIQIYAIVSDIVEELRQGEST